MIDISQFRDPIDISIPLRFNGPQPSAFGVEAASTQAVGDTRAGSSVNFDRITIVPHCNGTHTECVGHITHERISVTDCLKDILIPARLVSVGTELQGADHVISLSRLKSAGAQPPATSAGADALIIRTLPNDVSKLSRQYGEENIPPYFTIDAMEYIVRCGFKHLLVDMPSIDRLFDDGELSNHRIFWNVGKGSFMTHTDSRIYSTITELIYVPNQVADGKYLLNLQIAPFESDASPSRPLLFNII